jgi:hypothetical protein
MIADQRHSDLGKAVPGPGHLQELIGLLPFGQLPGMHLALLGMLTILFGCFHWSLERLLALGCFESVLAMEQRTTLLSCTSNLFEFAWPAGQSLHGARWHQPGPFNLDRDHHGENRLSMLIFHLNPNVLGDCTLQLKQSVLRQFTRAAPGLDLGHVKAVDLVANFIAVGRTVQGKVEIEAWHQQHELVRENNLAIEKVSRPLALLMWAALQAGGFGTGIAPTDRRDRF